MGEEGRNSRHPSGRDIPRPAKIGREEVAMIRGETSRSEQVRFVAAFPTVLAPKVLARQETRTCVCSLRAGKTYGRERPAKQVRATDGVQQKGIIKYTFEAGMCMKTKEHQTQCPNIIRLLSLNSRRLRRTECYFAENCCFATASCELNSVFRRIFRA